MQKWLFKSAVVLLFFLAAWLVVTTVWRGRNPMPATEDVLLYLVAVPVAVIAVISLLAKIVSSAALITRPGTTPAQTLAEDTDVAELAAGADEHALTLTILGSAIRTPHGSSAQELIDAFESNAARPALDPELVDASGFSILASRAQDIDEEAQREQFEAWHEVEALPKLNWTPEQLRAIAMATEIAVEIGRLAAVHPLFNEYVAISPDRQPAIAVPLLKVFALLPTSWSCQHRQAASLWLLHIVEQQGWPVDKILLDSEHDNASAAPLGWIDRLRPHMHRQTQPCLGILVACESHIGIQTITAWESSGRLVTQDHDAGLVPGEGAVGLLLADNVQAACMDMESAAIMHRVAQGRREKSADTRGRISADLIDGLIPEALESAGVQAAQIAVVVADTDHRASRMAELMAAGHANFPDLDLKEQYRLVAAGCGAAGAVSSLIALALAQHEAASSGVNAMCVSNCDAFERAAVVVGPRLLGPASSQSAM